VKIGEPLFKRVTRERLQKEEEADREGAFSPVISIAPQPGNQQKMFLPYCCSRYPPERQLFTKQPPCKPSI
jgi:hypothetical protein